MQFGYIEEDLNEIRYDKDLKLLWYKIFDNLECISYEDKYYLKGYVDCVIDSYSNDEVRLCFYDLLKGKLL